MNSEEGTFLISKVCAEWNLQNELKQSTSCVLNLWYSNVNRVSKLKYNNLITCGSSARTVHCNTVIKIDTQVQRSDGVGPTTQTLLLYGVPAQPNKNHFSLTCGFPAQLAQPYSFWSIILGQALLFMITKRCHVMTQSS